MDQNPGCKVTLLMHWFLAGQKISLVLQAVQVLQAPPQC